MLLLFATNGLTANAPNKDELLETLIFAMAQGDMKALETLYAHSKTAVYGFALSILKDRHSAEDVMQDTYVRLFRSASQYSSQGKPMAWILTIVRNLALMKLRKVGGEDHDTEVWDLPDRNDFTENSIDRMVLHTALQHLAEDERQIVMLHSVSGLKHREIAGILNIPLSTVLSKYRRSLSKLKKQIKEGEQ